MLTEQQRAAHRVASLAYRERNKEKIKERRKPDPNRAESDRRYYLKTRDKKIVRERTRKMLAPAPWWHRFKTSTPRELPDEATMLAAVEAACRRFRSREVREDAMSELVLFLLERRIGIDDLPLAATLWFRAESSRPPWLEIDAQTLTADTMHF